MALGKPFEASVVGNKFTITPYTPKDSPHIVRYSIRIRTWQPRGSIEYVASMPDLLRLRDWINSALIAERARIDRGDNDQQADQDNPV